jgi:hypothetical protein
MPLNEETRGLAEVEAHKPVIERETPHYFVSCVASVRFAGVLESTDHIDTLDRNAKMLNPIWCER